MPASGVIVRCWLLFKDLASDPEIFLSQSSDGDYTFSKPINLSNNTGNSFSPRVALLFGHQERDKPKRVCILYGMMALRPTLTFCCHFFQEVNSLRRINRIYANMLFTISKRAVFSFSTTIILAIIL